MSGPYCRLLCLGEKAKPGKQTAGTAFFIHKRHPPLVRATQRKHAFDPFYSADRHGVFDIAKIA
jgi:hypothetical protein